jgi:hypothetical protein
MLTDLYGLSLSTASPAARDACVQGCEAKLTMYPGAIEAFDRAIAADPGLPSPMPPERTCCWNAGTRQRHARPMAAANFPGRRSVRAGSQSYRIFRLAFGGRRRSRTFRTARAPERLATRRPGTRHHRVHPA